MIIPKLDLLYNFTINVLKENDKIHYSICPESRERTQTS